MGPAFALVIRESKCLSVTEGYVSSANTIDDNKLEALARSLKSDQNNIKNKKGPRMDPCGVTVFHSHFSCCALRFLMN